MHVNLVSIDGKVSFPLRLKETIDISLPANIAIFDVEKARVHCALGDTVHR